MLCESNKTDIQENYHSNILPALGKIIANDSENIRVRVHAISCLVSFLKGLVNESEADEVEDFSDVLKPYSKELLTLLANIFNLSLKINNKRMQESTLNAISFIANVLDSEFEPFYKDIVPFLKELLINLINNRNDSNKALISDIISTISFICSSINKNSELYMNDFMEFCNMFEALLGKVKEEDPEVAAILKAFSHISTSMKTNFYPYLEKIIGKLEAYCKADIDIKYEDADIEKVTEKSLSPGILLECHGVAKKFSMKTFVLANKTMAYDVIKDICLSMEAAYYPYIKRTLLLSKDIINLSYCRKLRKIGARTFEACVYACSNEKQQNEVFNEIFPCFLDKLSKDVETQCIRDIKYNLKVFIHIFTEVKSVNVVSEDFIRSLYQHLKGIVALMEARKITVKESVKHEDAFDENDVDGFSADIEVLNEVNRRVMELSGIIYKLYKESLTELVNSTLADLFYSILQKAVNETKDDQEIVYSLCFFTDVLAYSNTSTFRKVAPEFLKICRAIVTKNEDVIQNIIFGYGIFVERSDVDEYVPNAELISNSISNVITTMKATTKNGTCFDNAIASLGKVLFFKTQNSEEGLVLAKKFLDMLPLKHDLVESNSSLKLLCQQFLLGNPLISHNQNYDSIRKIFEKAVKQDEESAVLDSEAKDLMTKVKQIIN